MEKILGILSIMMIVEFIYMIVLEIKTRGALNRQAKRYEKGLDLGVFTLEELASLMSQVFPSEIILFPNDVMVKEGKLKVKFFLNENRVFVDYPSAGILIPKSISNLFIILRRNKRLQTAVLANEMMDRLALSFAPSEFVVEDGQYEKTRKTGKRIKIHTIAFSMILLILISAIYIEQEEKDMIESVKKATPIDYPDKTYEEVLNQTFNKPTWSYFEADNGEEVVEYSGYIKGKEEKEENKVLIQFILSEKRDRVDIGAIKVGNEVQSEAMKIIIMTRILEGTVGLDGEKESSGNKEETEKVVDKKTEVGERKSEVEKIAEKTIEKDESSNENTGSEVKGEGGASNAFVFPDSDRRYLTEDELASYNKGTLRVARNEIYARHGRIFKDEALNQYFNSQSWYVPLVDGTHFDEGVLNEFEKQNLQSIKMMEDYVPDGEFNPNLFGGEQVADGSSPQIVEEQTPSVYRINYDISYEDLLRRGVAGMPVYIDGTVRSVYDYSLYMKDVYGKEYHINDKRINKTVILEGDYISVYGQYIGPYKSGEVSPSIDWIE